MYVLMEVIAREADMAGRQYGLQGNMTNIFKNNFPLDIVVIVMVSLL